MITRNSDQSTVTIPEPQSFPELEKEVERALRDEVEFTYDKHYRHCGLPYRLLLPKGKPEGMYFKLYVVISDFNKDVVSNSVD